MSFASTWRENETRGLRGLGALLVIGLVTLIVFVGGAIFLWPRDPDVSPPTTYTTVKLEDLKVHMPQQFTAEGLPLVWLVRLDEKEVIALIGRDTSKGCTVPWRPATSFNGQQGWFRDPCSGSVYDIEGNCVYGPCPRGLDRYEVRMRGSTVQIVTDEAQIIRGKLGKIAIPVRP